MSEENTEVKKLEVPVSIGSVSSRISLFEQKVSTTPESKKFNAIVKPGNVTPKNTASNIKRGFDEEAVAAGDKATTSSTTTRTLIEQEEEDEEKRLLEEERRKFEEEKKRLEEERAKYEKERLEKEKLKFELERRKMEEERLKIEEERLRLERERKEEQRQMEEDRKKLEALKLEEERRRMEDNAVAAVAVTVTSTDSNNSSDDETKEKMQQHQRAIINKLAGGSFLIPNNPVEAIDLPSDSVCSDDQVGSPVRSQFSASFSNSSFAKPKKSTMKSSLPEVPTICDPQDALCRVLVVYPYEAENDAELSFGKGDMINVYKKNDNGWWVGELNGKTGLFPSNYVQDATAVSRKSSIRLPTLERDSYKEGFLTKKGHMVKNWKLRWFVLKKDQLLYYKTPKDIKPAGSILLDGTVSVDLVEDKKKPFSFAVREASGRITVISADSQKAMMDWVTAIREVKTL